MQSIAPFLPIDNAVLKYIVRQWIYRTHELLARVMKNSVRRHVIGFTIFATSIGYVFFLLDSYRRIYLPVALLPAFPGMRALKDLWDSNTLHFGATSHFVDSSIDGGKIIAQVVGCVDRTKGFNIVERISFAHKVYLFLVVWELVETGRLHPSMVNYDGLKRHIWANPSIQSKKLIDNFEMFLIEENIEWTR